MPSPVFPNYLYLVTTKEIAEIQSLTDKELDAMIRIKRLQCSAPLFIGDRKKAEAVYQAASLEKLDRLEKLLEVDE